MGRRSRRRTSPSYQQSPQATPEPHQGKLYVPGLGLLADDRQARDLLRERIVRLSADEQASARRL